MALRGLLSGTVKVPVNGTVNGTVNGSVNGTVTGLLRFSEKKHVKIGNFAPFTYGTVTVFAS